MLLLVDEQQASIARLGLPAIVLTHPVSQKDRLAVLQLGLAIIFNWST